MNETFDHEAEEVILANEKFYLAVNRADMDLMSDVWLGGPDDKCVHPGWPMLYGWEAIKESWKNIFGEGGPETVEISQVSVEVAEGLAWVVCVEKVIHRAGDDDMRIGFAQSTNVFHKTGSGWKLVVHHASPIPMPRTEAVSDTNLQ
ncbi:MAG TPA: nuclear transport factor 2 family protein [Thermodesulfobacteriota bacterium]|nr:nuclear transport factor 2 family protein [Thermodesulfobacteriota bacterium]